MSVITDALSQGALPSIALYARVEHAYGSRRSYERDLADTPNLLRLGTTKNRVYGLVQPHAAPTPIWMRDEAGRDSCVGSLQSMSADQWAFIPSAKDAPVWLGLGHIPGLPNVHQGLPWFLEPFRPAGFLGRTWVREHAQAHGWTQDVTAWTDDQVITAVLQEPWDWRGNLAIGLVKDALEQWVPAANRRAVYAQRADQVMRGMVVGASADGEQPKFTAVVDEGHEQRPVIVKFSQRMTNDRAARRWADVMVTEAIASQVLTLHGLSAAPTQVWEHDDRLWLETTRFDRVGASGRRGMVSLRALALAYNYRGPQGGWVDAVRHLQRQGVVAPDDVARTERLATISHLLSNNDMHMGNLAFLLPPDTTVLPLAPVYDMTPMRWIPSLTTGVVPELDTNEALYRTTDREALAIAYEMWSESADHPLVSEEWRSFTAHRAERINRMLVATSQRDLGVL